ncbi:MAG TPA: helix-turn-helix transcriptional regulator [Candidatus Sulfotelmatobacter sp.]|nr:helix-turn-helix transcriptional regulator [Candidatus Sulfotelmatobacter sp.]
MARKDVQTLEQWAELAKQAKYDPVAVARLLNVGPRQLRRYTRKILNTTPQRWLDEQRLTQATAMLKSQELVKTVAFDLGFKTVAHFSNRFKARYGVCPKEYREGRAIISTVGEAANLKP